MPRTPEFNQQEVLHNAMQLFWQKGYALTSVKDLTEATQLQPGSLYGAFRNKKHLFKCALEYYFNELYQQVETILSSQDAPLTRIRSFFEHLITQFENDTQRKSCLMLNTLLQTPAQDIDINQRVCEMFDAIESKFQAVLIEAQAAGDLVPEANPATLSKLLMSGIFGLQAYNKIHSDRDVLLQIVDNLLTPLNP